MIMFDNDDRCQHPDECIKSCFTYCPHCHLFLCITHLKQHHNTMKNDISQIINEGDNQRIFLEQQINKIKQQQIVLNNFYEQEIKHLNDMHKFVCENKLNSNNLPSLMFEYEKNVKQFDIIKQEQEKKSLIIQIDQILQQQNQMIDLKSKDEDSIMDNATTTTDTCSEGQTKDGEDSIVDSIMDRSSIDNHNETDSDSFSLKSKWLINLPNPICPLSHANAFGFSTAHNIPGMPCNFIKTSNSLTYGRCHYHLTTYHRLKPSVAEIIMRYLSSNENKIIDLTTLDIFSKWPSNNILSRSKSLFVSHCPLTQENIYGIQSQHNVTLCIPRSPIHLYQHLRIFHRLKSTYALRLITALINNEPPTKEIFKSNEQIINKSIRKTN